MFRYDRAIGSVLIGFSLLLYFVLIPWGIEHSVDNPGVGLDPSFLPRLTALLLGALSIPLVVRPSTWEKRVRLFPRRALIATALFIAYIAVTPLIGYLPATLLVLGTYLYFFGVRSWPTLIGVTVVTSFLLYYFFAKVMLVMLPSGILFD